MHLPAEKDREVNRKQLWGILHYGRGLTGHAYEFVSIILILVSLAILPLEFLPSFVQYHSALATIEIITTSLFTIDFVLRLYAAPRRLRYIFSFYGLIDILSIAPFYIGLLGTQYLRALRLLRLLKLGEMKAAAAEDEESTMEEVVGLVDGEKVEYVVSRHPIFLLVGCIPPLLSLTVSLGLLMLLEPSAVSLSVVVTLLLFTVIFLWKTWLDFGYDVIYVTSRRLIFQNQHIFGRSINQINYPAITNVKPYYPGVFSYILRYGTIFIETQADQFGHVELHTVKQHEKAAHIIMQNAIRYGAGQSHGQAASSDASGTPG